MAKEKRGFGHQNWCACYVFNLRSLSKPFATITLVLQMYTALLAEQACIKSQPSQRDPRFDLDTVVAFLWSHDCTILYST